MGPGGLRGLLGGSDRSAFFRRLSNFVNAASSCPPRDHPRTQKSWPNFPDRTSRSSAAPACSCSRNCARFGATIGRAVRTSCSSLARRPNPPIVRVSSSQNSPDSSLPVAAQRALDRAGREGVPAERRLPHIKMRVFDTRQSAIAVVCCRSTRSEPSPARIVTGSDRARAI